MQKLLGTLTISASVVGAMLGQIAVEAPFFGVLLGAALVMSLPD